MRAVQHRPSNATSSFDSQPVTPLQGRLEAAEQQLQRWRLILDGAADCATPEDVLHLLNRLQQQHVQAAVQVGDKAAEAAQLRSQVEAAAAAQREAEADAAAARAAAEEAAAGLSRAERKLALLGKERDGLKAILASYDEEYLNQHGGWSLPSALGLQGGLCSSCV